MMRARVFGAVLALALLVPALASAQTDVPKNATFTVVFDQPAGSAENTTHYKVFVDGTQVGSDAPFASAFSNGVVTVRNVNGATGAYGTHRLEVQAVGPTGLTSNRDGVDFRVVAPAPGGVGGVRIVLTLTQAQNGVDLRIESMEPIVGVTAERQVLVPFSPDAGVLQKRNLRFVNGQWEIDEPSTPLMTGAPPAAVSIRKQ